MISSSASISKSISILNDPPSWVFKPSASTDWNLIEEARKLRELPPTSCKFEKNKNHSRYSSIAAISPTTVNIDKALDASGLTKSTKTLIMANMRPGIGFRLSSRIIMILFFLILVIMFDWILCPNKIDFDDTLFPSAVSSEDTSPLKCTKVHSISENTSERTNHIKEEIPNTSFSSNPVVTKENFEADTVLQHLIWTVTLTCDDSCCSTPIESNVVTKQTDLRKSRRIIREPPVKRWKKLHSNILFARDIIQEDPECFFVF